MMTIAQLLLLSLVRNENYHQWHFSCGFCTGLRQKHSSSSSSSSSLTRARRWPLSLDSSSSSNAPTVSPSSNLDSDEEQQTVCPAAATAAGAPYSKSYPRYRIDLTSASPPENNNNDKSNNIINFGNPLQTLWGWQQDQARVRMEQDLRKEEKRSGKKIKFSWLSEVSKDMDAMSILWETAADLVSIGSEEDNNFDDVVLAFPDLAKNNKNKNPPRVLIQWIDILNWIKEEHIPAWTYSQEQQVQIDAKFSNEPYNVPTIRLTNTRRQKGRTGTATSRAISNALVDKRMQSWVKRILVDLSICPFTKSTKMSGQGLADLGVPVGRIAYHTSSANGPAHIFLLLSDTWKAICGMIQAGPGDGGGGYKSAGISSILLAAPGFDDDFDVWAGPVFAVLEASVVAASAEDAIGVVCFHPLYAVSDGTGWPGFGHMHSVPRLQQWCTEQQQQVSSPSASSSLDDDQMQQPLSEQDVAAGAAWQRRTPHATINVLRADQLAVAEGRRNTASMYADNINKLVGQGTGIGSQKLLLDLTREQNMTDTKLSP